MRSLRPRVVLALLGGLLANVFSASYSQELGTACNPRIDLTSPPSLPVVTDTFEFEVVVRNACSDGTNFRVDSLMLALPSEMLAGTRQKRVAFCRTDIGEPSLACAGFDLNAGTAVSLKASVQAAPSVEFLTYRSADQQLTVELRYVELKDNEEKAQQATIATTLTSPQGPLAGNVAGGIVGVFFLVVFRHAYSALFGGGKARRFPWRLLAFGSFVAAAAIVALKYAFPLLSGSLGLTVQVRDAVGGVALGLAFEPLARRLAELLKIGPAPGSPGM